MIQRFLIGRDITDKAVINAFRKVDRRDFVPKEFKDDAYIDSPLPIGEGQTNSQPYIIAKMLQELEIRPEDKVLEIGFGCGYTTALLSCMAKKVIATEVHDVFLKIAKRNLKNIKNIELHITKKELGYKKQAPYDRIIVNAAPSSIPEELVEQLKENGIMVLPVGLGYFQELVKVKKANGRITSERICGCSFVPLILPDNKNK